MLRPKARSTAFPLSAVSTTLHVWFFLLAAGPATAIDPCATWHRGSCDRRERHFHTNATRPAGYIGAHLSLELEPREVLTGRFRQHLEPSTKRGVGPPRVGVSD